MGEWCGVSFLGGDGSYTTLLACKFKSGQIVFEGRYMSGNVPLDSISTPVSGSFCGKNCGGQTAGSPCSVVVGVVSSFLISSCSGQGCGIAYSLCDRHDTSSVGCQRYINDVGQRTYLSKNESWYPAYPKPKFSATD